MQVMKICISTVFIIVLSEWLCICRILVLDAGQVKEFAAPNELLSNKKSRFYSMAKDAGLVA